MKKHKGMRSLDIVILVKIATLGTEWQMKDLAAALFISQSEVSESLNRSRISGLLTEDKKRLMKNNLLDFLEHGLRFVFPAIPGSIQRGMLTAHSASPLKEQIFAEESFVWPFARGEARGQAVEPLHPGVPEACIRDPILYEMLALVDSVRLGRVREKQLAVAELRQRIL